MAKVLVEGIGEFYQHYPRPATIVTCHARGKDNAMACAWHSALSRTPPLFGVAISPKRFTYELILEAREFGVNFIPFDGAGIAAAMGGSSGRDVDKMERFRIARERPAKTSVPILEEAYAAYECKLTDHITCGDHEWFVGEIVAVHLKEGLLDDKGVLNLKKALPALYLGADFYVTVAAETVKYLERPGP